VNVECNLACSMCYCVVVFVVSSFEWGLLVRILKIVFLDSGAIVRLVSLISLISKSSRCLAGSSEYPGAGGTRAHNLLKCQSARARRGCSG
jgi:hypothetical protein